MTFEYDPFAEEIRLDPHPTYKRLRDEAPVYYMAKYDAWALSRFQDIWDVCSSDALSASRGTTPAQLLTKDQPVSPMINVMDPPSHTKLRSVIRTCFLPRHVRSVEPIEATCGGGGVYQGDPEAVRRLWRVTEEPGLGTQGLERGLSFFADGIEIEDASLENDNLVQRHRCWVIVQAIRELRKLPPNVETSMPETHR